MLRIQANLPSGEAIDLPIQSSVIIGRALNCTIVVQDLLSSRQHAEFSTDGTTVWVQDLQSSNGSFLNGRRLLEKMVVSDGDVLSIGHLQFTLSTVKEQQAAIEQFAVSDLHVLNPAIVKQATDLSHRDKLDALQFSMLVVGSTLVHQNLPQYLQQLLHSIERIYPDSGCHLQVWLTPTTHWNQLRPCIGEDTLSNWIDPVVLAKMWSDHRAVTTRQSNSTVVVFPFVRLQQEDVKLQTPEIVGVLSIRVTDTTHDWTQRLLHLGLMISPQVLLYYKQYLLNALLVKPSEWVSFLIPPSEIHSVTSMIRQFQVRWSVLQYLLRWAGWSDVELEKSEYVCAMTMAGPSKEERERHIQWVSQHSNPVFKSVARQVVQILETSDSPIGLGGWLSFADRLVEKLKVTPFQNLNILSVNQVPPNQVVLQLSQFQTLRKLVHQLDSQDEDTQVIAAMEE